MRGDTTSPSFRSSSLDVILLLTQVGFARAIDTISRLKSAGIGGRPDRDFHRQNSRQPWRCQRIKRVWLDHGQYRAPVQPGITARGWRVSPRVKSPRLCVTS